mmetsp:Transcript_23068/g.35706  ORF Transcript_23068/g.35706 Transcript_23068/m.35706 type:complete len:172 (+) Transcript_23068:951-1466(+)
MGVLCTKDNHIDLEEYSELSPELMHKRKPDGRLFLSLGNLLVFMMGSGTLLEMCESKSLSTMYHKAFKKLPVWDPISEKTVKPESENGYKFELFIQAILPRISKHAFRALVIERNQEFAPVKNADAPERSKSHGSASTAQSSPRQEVADSPASALRLLSDLHRGWVKAAII